MSQQSYGPDRYVAPGHGLEAALGKTVAWLARRGVSLLGSRELAVRGRKTGRLQTIPVNLLHDGGRRYLVAIRGNTQWVRNVRAAGGAAQLRLGRRAESVRLVEIPVADRVPVLRLYLKRWWWEVSQFVPGVTRDSSEADLLAAADGIPAFEVLAADAAQ